MSNSRSPAQSRSFAADMVELLFLCGVQILLAGFEIGAGIDHVAVEPEAVKIVGDVVVVTYRSTIGGHAVPAPCKQACREAQRHGFAEPLGQRNADAQHLLKPALDLDLAIDIGLAQPRDVAGEQMACQPRRVEFDRDVRFGCELERFSVPKDQSQRKRLIREAVAKLGKKPVAQRHRGVMTLVAKPSVSRG